MYDSYYMTYSWLTIIRKISSRNFWWRLTWHQRVHPEKNSFGLSGSHSISFHSCFDLGLQGTLCKQTSFHNSREWDCSVLDWFQKTQLTLFWKQFFASFANNFMCGHCTVVKGYTFQNVRCGREWCHRPGWNDKNCTGGQIL